MIYDCFLYTVDKLRESKIELPKEYEGYTLDDRDGIVKDSKRLRAKNIHIEYFKSFGEVVDTATFLDVVCDRKTVGLAINEFKKTVISEETGKPALRNIKDSDIIVRVK